VGSGSGGCGGAIDAAWDLTNVSSEATLDSSAGMVFCAACCACNMLGRFKLT
jgi:hypothetical protein